MHAVSFILVIVGALNWLLMGLFSWDIGMIFGDAGNTIARIIYILVGLAGVYLIFSHKKDCMMCGKGGMGGDKMMGGMKQGM